jgi:hypothetical protein
MNVKSVLQCCGAVTIFYGSGSDFRQVTVTAPIFGKLRFRFRVRLHIYTIKSSLKKKFENILPFYIVRFSTREKLISFIKYIVKYE